MTPTNSQFIDSIAAVSSDEQRVHSVADGWLRNIGGDNGSDDIAALKLNLPCRSVVRKDHRGGIFIGYQNAGHRLAAMSGPLFGLKPRHFTMDFASIDD